MDAETERDLWHDNCLTLGKALNAMTAERDKYKAALERINSWGCRYGDGYPNHCAACVANVALNSEP